MSTTSGARHEGGLMGRITRRAVILGALAVTVGAATFGPAGAAFAAETTNVTQGLTQTPTTRFQTPGSAQMLNPQPLPPGGAQMLNPQPLPPKAIKLSNIRTRR
ncbi:MAG: hypothetical protein IT305_24165 [Chloroflexi bacterium]|nr:hypothetical protein [Chloroflexota bacterium]